MSNGLCEQALKSGQLPADFKLSDDNAQSGSIQGTDESKVQNNENEADGEPRDVEGQGKDESAPMEQVLICLPISSKLTLTSHQYNSSI